jgi:ATP-dependent phosphofructokinase / diphosphate-dependent phosphofructokinase
MVQNRRMRIGILTGGGDCPGLNAVIRSAVRTGIFLSDHSFVGYRDGWRGVVEGEQSDLTSEDVRGILHRGGTILGTSGADPLRLGGSERVAETIERDKLGGLIAIGGEGTLGSAAKLAAEGLPIVGVPKTIDNDLAMTDFTIGFHTAVHVATEAIDRLHSTAESHNRVMVIEVMGRHAGWIAAYAGLAGGADAILIPERPFDMEEVCARLRQRHVKRSSFSIVVVAEGAVPAPETMELPEYELDENGFPRLGGISGLIAASIEQGTGFVTRVTILGHVQRGGTPVSFDRVLGTRLGAAAVDVATAGGWGRMATLYEGDVVDVPLADAVAERKVVPESLWRSARVFFG